MTNELGILCFSSELPNQEKTGQEHAPPHCFPQAVISQPARESHEQCLMLHSAMQRADNHNILRTTTRFRSSYSHWNTWVFCSFRSCAVSNASCPTMTTRTAGGSETFPSGYILVKERQRGVVWLLGSAEELYLKEKVPKLVNLLAASCRRTWEA